MTSEGFSLDDGEFEVDRDDSDLFGAPPDDEPPLTEDEEELLAASKQGRLDKVKALVNRGCRVNQRSPADETPLILAAKHGKKAVVQFLVASTNCDINAVDRWSRSPLLFAISHGLDDLVIFMIESGADVEQISEHDGVSHRGRAMPISDRMKESIRTGIILYELRSQLQDALATSLVTNIIKIVLSYCISLSPSSKSKR